MPLPSQSSFLSYEIEDHAILAGELNGNENVCKASSSMSKVLILKSIFNFPSSLKGEYVCMCVCMKERKRET